MPYTTQVKLLDAILVDTTGETFAVGDRVKMSAQFISANADGSGLFTIEISNDATNWVQFNRLTDNVVNSINEGDVRVASVTLSTATNKIYFFPKGDHFEYIRAKVDVTTGGIYSVILHTVIG